MFTIFSNLYCTYDLKLSYLNHTDDRIYVAVVSFSVYGVVKHNDQRIEDFLLTEQLPVVVGDQVGLQHYCSHDDILQHKVHDSYD